MYFIIFSISFLIMIMLVVLTGMRFYDNHKVEQIRIAMNNVKGEGVFSDALIQDLPERVQKYFRHAIAPGTVLAASVELELKGHMVKTGRSKLMPMHALEILTGRAFVWQGRLWKGLLRFQGSDMYVAKTSRQLWWFWNLLPWSVKHGADHARFSAAHAGLGRIWLPSTLLPMYGVVWSEGADGKLTAKFAVDNYPFTLVFEVNEEGAIRSAVLNRWCRSGRNQDYSEERYGVIAASEELQSSGYTIPGVMKIGWLDAEEGTTVVYNPEIEVAQFQ